MHGKAIVLSQVTWSNTVHGFTRLPGSTLPYTDFTILGLLYPTPPYFSMALAHSTLLYLTLPCSIYNVVIWLYRYCGCYLLLYQSRLYLLHADCILWWKKWRMIEALIWNERYKNFALDTIFVNFCRLPFTRSILTRSIATRSTLTRSTCHEINSHKINLSQDQLNFLC